MIVMKFGGTSVGTGERIANVARIAAQTFSRSGTAPVVVVSAMSGVTDSLVRAATTAAAGDRRTFRLIRDELQQRHEQAIVDCGIDSEHGRGLRAEIDNLLNWFETLCQSINTLGELTPRGLDAVSGLGERLSARITAAAMLTQGLKANMVEATEILITDNNFGSAKAARRNPSRAVSHLAVGQSRSVLDDQDAGTRSHGPASSRSVASPAVPWRR